MGDYMTTIGSVAEIFDGPHATPTKTNEGPFYLSISSLENGRLDLSKSARLSEEDCKKWTKRVTPQMGDVLFSYETRLGEAALMPSGIRACLGRRMGLLRPRPNKVIPEYLLYTYLSPAFQQIIVANTITGATVDRIALNEMPDFPVRIPDLEEQKKVAGLLKHIDGKIDCNNRINAELEVMAKTLYDYWFVQFDFPDANGKPYKSSGGKMVYNATLKREIPLGWEAMELSDVISRSGTGLNPRDNFQLGNGNNYYVTIKNVTNGKITLDDKCDRVDDEALKIIDRRSQLQVGDVLFTSIEPVGVTYLIQKKPENWNINESVFTIRPDYKKTTSEHLFCLLSSSEMKVFTKNSSTGSIHKGIRHGVLKTYPLAYGSKDLIDRFSVAVKPMLKRMDVLENENQHLTQLRDWLLPMLMNGQVTVA